VTAADVQAIAESVIAVSAAGAVLTWLYRTSRRAWKWRRNKRAKRVRDDAFPLVIGVVAVVLVLAKLMQGDDS
jgi:hypothetical protein